MVRGFAIVSQYGQIKQVEAHTFKVKSQSGNGQYVITNEKSWVNAKDVLRQPISGQNRLIGNYTSCRARASLQKTRKKEL